LNTDKRTYEEDTTMTAEDTSGVTAVPSTTAPELEKLAPHIAAHVEAPVLRANLSAIASAETDELEATASAVGLVKVAGDANVSASWVPAIIAKQNISFQQGYASAVIAGNETHIKQGGAPIIIGRTMEIDSGGGVLLVGGDVSVKNGFVGVVLSRNTAVSEDSRVLLGTKGAMIIAAAILGGFGLVAVVMALGVKRVVEWKPNFQLPEMPDWDALGEKLRRLRG
jgi:hypothetical protein